MVEFETLEFQPDLLALHQNHPGHFPYLLTSAGCGGDNGQYDILFAFPQQQITCSNSQTQPFIHFLESLEFDKQVLQSPLPFIGGWFLYFSYEYAQLVEPSLHLPTGDFPLAVATRIPAGIIYNYQDSITTLFCETEFSHLFKALKQAASTTEPLTNDINFSSTFNEEPASQYLDSVLRAKKYIQDGDIFQANLSRQWNYQFSQNPDPSKLFENLMQNNPSPFSALLKLGEYSILSSSPERLVNVEAGNISVRPIAGTHPRADAKSDDLLLSSRLLSHPKEKAEHIMLIDLERNDLGRVCEPGTIHVDELMVLESYRHVHHIVSNVKGKLKAGMTLKDVLHAVFPGGTITGCPKVRCMEIIAELEESPRDFYTGSAGYFSHNGKLDLNILIRTIAVKGNQARFRAGAGIVADSDPQKELEETRHKAEGMIRGLA